MEETIRLSTALGSALRRLDARVTTAESCTGGGIAEAITRVPGSSAWFEVGYVTYSNAQKSALLDVPANVLGRLGAVSREVVELMAAGAQRRSGARFAVAVSGIAGPDGGTPEKPVGTVWLAWADGATLHAQRHLFEGDRQEVRQQTVDCALEGLLHLSQGGIPGRG